MGLDVGVDHYERLGVDRDFTPADLRRAYRELARLHHPDRNQGDAQSATQTMAAINEAFEVLSDPVKRFDYNRSLRRGTSQAKSTTHTSPAAGQTKRAAPGRPARPTPPPPDDDPIRRARREAKEREAAEAKSRGYKDPGGGFFGGSKFRRRK